MKTMMKRNVNSSPMPDALLRFQRSYYDPDRFECGFLVVHRTFREYLAHIATCKHPRCSERRHNHADLRQSLGLSRLEARSKSA